MGVQAKPGSELARLRNWYFDIALSGDIIVEQNIHAVDVANWLLGGHPVRAEGRGGRKVRTDVGDTWDHYAVIFEYPDEVLLDFGSNQFAPGFQDICARVYGSEGTVDTHYGGEVSIASTSGKWPGGETKQIFQQGAVNNIKDFHAAIMSGEYLNNTRESADSTMACILGRMAAHEGRAVTWDEMLAANERLDPQLDLPENGSVTVPPKP